ncbi:MAG: 50S ribosomal protein L2 [Parcubacteria group bacterium LiPW_41]|nr:MAG: 50S ribosomal protein L2 [Parcubacteria group bacterium LiPW_41]
MKQYKPTTQSRRHMSVVDYSKVSKEGPMKKATKRLKTHAGRNSQGRITMRHQGGGNKKLYREIDFKQMKKGVPGKIETIEYDPYRSAFIARVSYKDGDRRYILAPNALKVGDTIISGDDALIAPGNRTSLKRIPVGTFVHNIEITPGKGGQIARSAGNSVQVLANENGYTQLKMPSGEIRKVLWDCYATIGVVSNPEYSLVNSGKAGRSRWLGIRPTVRGKAMNPRDHPYGGGEGSQPRGTKRPKTKWGKVTGGKKTRNKKKWSNKLVVRRRVKK